VGSCAEKDCLEKIVVEVSVEAWLLELVKHRNHIVTLDEPGFGACRRYVAEGAFPPNGLSVPAEVVRLVARDLLARRILYA
jgi:hypothetical protein